VANWPLVLIEFAIESLYKLALTVPVVGGALMVAALVGTDLQSILAGGAQAATDLVIGSLATAPAALTSFLAALGLVALGGEVLMFIVKAGTLSVIVAGERQADAWHRYAEGGSGFRQGSAWSLAALYEGARRFGARAARLAAWLGLAYFVIGLAYFLVVRFGFRFVLGSAWAPTWPVVVVLATSAGVVTIAVVNLAYDLMRVIMITDDCRLSEAFGRLRTFVLEDARQVIGIFAVMAGGVMLATAIGLVATAGLTLIAWVPFVGLLFVPLQAAAWLIRGLLFQYLGLTTLAAYQTQYRRFSDTRWQSRESSRTLNA
jgi:hypothetical protein